LKDALQDNRRGNLAIGRFWDYKGGWSLDDFVCDNHITSNWQTMHEVGIVGPTHVF
jgi:hypothetical protein